ncbi:hypothetical protein Rhopal_005575-T1 [Rhodotorula paludigena]|uniref:Zn(2)-C6 fungal-type domain-containing protein n=1 Tax=Rhodotorula paludigena TaxID=86838 RepID=A0AAV5GRL8_9BASI|nr:hypothetical protein Rhopal_005575-T1 [Rhodotorula paludigena]
MEAQAPPSPSAASRPAGLYMPSSLSGGPSLASFPEDPAEQYYGLSELPVPLYDASQHARAPPQLFAPHDPPFANYPSAGETSQQLQSQQQREFDANTYGSFPYHTVASPSQRAPLPLGAVPSPYNSTAAALGPAPPYLPPRPPASMRRHSRAAGEPGGPGSSGPLRGIGGARGVQDPSGEGESKSGSLSVPAVGMHGRGGAASAAAAGSAGAVGSAGQSEQQRRSSVTALAAVVGTRTTEKSCKNCRVRKVKCDRRWPRCQRCKDRGDECDFGTFVPAALEGELASLRTGTRHSSSGEASGSGRGAFPTPFSGGGYPSGQTSVAAGAAGAAVSPGSLGSHSTGAASLGAGYPPVFPTLEGYPRNEIFGVTSQRARSSLSESIHAVFSQGAGLGEPGSVGDKTVEIFLRGVALQDPDLYSVALRGLGPLLGPGEPGRLPPVSENATEWKLVRSAMGQMLVVHLVQSFFASCCAYLPAFYGWHERRNWILHNIDTLDPASRVAVAAFCAMGARASPHSAILGISLPSPSPTDWFEQASAAGVRREQACRALHQQAMDLVHLLGITYDVSRENLEALMVMSQLLIFNELVPRRSRAMILSAIGQYKELQDSAASPETKDDTLKHIGLPILICDAVTSAYARKKPLITKSDLVQHFPSFVPPDPRKENIQSLLQACLRDNLSPTGSLTHDGITKATEIVHSWLAQGQRLFAESAAYKVGGPPASLVNDIRDLWQLLDQIHEAIRKMQEMLVHLSYTPDGCASDGCADQHLRFITRLDKDLLDGFFLIHSLVTENLGLDSLIGENAQLIYAESDKRVRKALKLVAFYLELYITSRDPHMTYHVVWQLEVLPNWTLIAVQRYGEQDGPPTAELEVSDTELDWLVKGLICASYYHPVANARLQELRHARRPSYPGAQPPTPQPPPDQAPPHSRQQHTSIPFASSSGPTPVTSGSATNAYRPSTTHYFNVDVPASGMTVPTLAPHQQHEHEQDPFTSSLVGFAATHPVPPAGAGIGHATQVPHEAVGDYVFEGIEAGPPFQSGVTAPERSRPWGVWGTTDLGASG